MTAPEDHPGERNCITCGGEFRFNGDFFTCPCDKPFDPEPKCEGCGKADELNHEGFCPACARENFNDDAAE